MPSVNLDAIPSEIKNLPQWVNWRYENRAGKPTKVPYMPDGRRANTTDPRTWSAFAECARAAAQFDGIGIVCASGLAGIDLDHCLDAQGNLSAFAHRVVTQMRTYTEITPSGRGLHCLCWGELPDGGRRKDALGIELYDEARYFTVTGHRLPNTPATLEHREEELAQLHTELFSTGSEIAHSPEPTLRFQPAALDDRQLVAKATRAKNGEAFARLWAGDLSGHQGNHSDADLALCAHLAFWTGGDATQMDRLFRQSGLMRPKWNERHSARGETYGQMTIAKALARAREPYTAERNPAPRENSPGADEAIPPVVNESPTPLEEQIAVLEQMVATIPQDADKLQLPFLLHPLLDQLARQDKAFATTFLARKVKEHFGLTRVEMTAYESSVAKRRKEWERAEHERKARETAAARGETIQPVEMSDTEYAEAMEFLRDPRIADRIAEDITALGYVGEEHSKVTVYFVASSRKQMHPLSAVIKSPSAYGKSEEVKSVAALMPPEEVREFTRLTPQALTYMPRDALKHKLLIVTERDGSEASDYTIRVMQSEQKISIAYPTKDPETGELHTEEHEVNGPIAYIETTTRPTIHSENATRVFELYLDGSERQTRQVHAAQRRNATIAGLRGKKQRERIIRRHQNAQRLLQPVQVVIPYAEFIDFPAENPRTRRDLPRLLEMIKVTAFLRQFQKERHRDIDPDTGEQLEYIEADLWDYAVAYRYAAPAIAQGLDELPKHSRELLDKIRTMVREKIEPKDGVKQFTRRDVRIHCHVTDKFVKDYVRALEDTEYLEIVSGDGGRGKKYVYQLPEAILNESDGPMIVKGLTTPDELAEMVRRATSQ